MEETKKDEFKWMLKRSGHKVYNSWGWKDAIQKLDTFPLWKDSKAREVTAAEYKKMVEDKEVAPPTGYTDVKEGEIGIVCISYYGKQWEGTWDAIWQCFSDFKDGYNCAYKLVKFLRDWDEALQMMADAVKAKSNLKKAIKAARRMLEEQERGEEMDAGFDAGEWSGPAHDKIREELMEKIAKKHGVDAKQIWWELQREEADSIEDLHERM